MDWQQCADASSEPAPGGMRRLVDDLRYPEGPLLRAGMAYCVEYARHTLLAFDRATGRLATVWQQDGFGPAAVACASDGSFWLTGSDAGALQCLDERGLAQARVDKDEADRTLPSPNDLVFDRHGRLWFTASGVFDPHAPAAGGVYCRDPNGRIRHVAADIRYANGIALAHDGRTCFVAEHLRNRVLAFDLSDDGRLTERRVFADLARLAPLASDEPLLGPDGLACAANGELVIAQFGGGRLLRVRGDGTLAAIHSVPWRYPTNVAIDADERTWLTTAMEANEAPYRGALCLWEWP